MRLVHRDPDTSLELSEDQTRLLLDIMDMDGNNVTYVRFEYCDETITISYDVSPERIAEYRNMLDDIHS